MQVGPDRCVAARDVESHAGDADLVVVGRHTADRHDVAQVAVGHEGGVLGAARDPLKLGERLLLVLPEYVHGSGEGGVPPG